jgi:hypothetical protein
VPLGRSGADPHPNSLDFTTEDYLELVDWAGRALRENKRGAIPGEKWGQIYLRSPGGKRNGTPTVLT